MRVVPGYMRPKAFGLCVGGWPRQTCARIFSDRALEEDCGSPYLRPELLDLGIR